MTEKIKVDLAHMTPRLLAAAGELLGASALEALAGPKQPIAIAAIAAIQNPDFTFDELCDRDLADFDIVNDDPKATPKARGASNGTAPRKSLASGV